MKALSGENDDCESCALCWVVVLVLVVRIWNLETTSFGQSAGFLVVLVDAGVKVEVVPAFAVIFSN